MDNDWKDVYSNRVIFLLKKYLKVNDSEKIAKTDKKIEEILMNDYSKEELISILFSFTDNFESKEFNSLCKMLLVQYYAHYTDNVDVAKKLIEKGFNFFEKEQDDFLFVLDKNFQGTISDDEYIELIIKNKDILANFYSSLKDNEKFFEDMCKELGIEFNSENVEKLKNDAIRNFSEVMQKKPNICNLSGLAWENYINMPDLEIVNEKYEFFLNPVVLLKLGADRIVNLYERQIQMLNNSTNYEVLAKICDLLKEFPYYSLSSKINSYDFFSKELFEAFTYEEILFLNEKQQLLLSIGREDDCKKLKSIFALDKDANIPMVSTAINDLEMIELLGLDEKNASKLEKIYKTNDQSFVKKMSLYLIKKKAQNTYKRNNVEDNN